MFVTQCQDVHCLCHEEHYQKVSGHCYYTHVAPGSSNTGQQSLFQCLYSQCDSPDYGPALIHSMRTCIATGADIHMTAAMEADQSLLHAREVEYLAGRELPEVPGLQLRQESAGGQGFGFTTTVWVTTTVTVTTGALGVTPFITGGSAPTNNPNAGGIGPGFTVTLTVTVTAILPGNSLPQISLANFGSHDANIGGGPITSYPVVNGTATPTRPWLVTTSETRERRRPSRIGLLLCAAAMLVLDLYVNVC